ncbi:MAG: hypothetical protein IJZ04_03700 [Clostridia bacterium]|nr:hypothetical protein [Clostridia bacterium]
MKKILSILLALILCVGTLVSCGNEETSSSESVSQIQSGTESASETNTSDIYYDRIWGLGDSGTDSLPGKEIGSYYSFFTNYDKFMSDAYAYTNQKKNLDTSVFDEYVVFEVINYTSTSCSMDILGYRDIVINENTASLTLDYTLDEDSRVNMARYVYVSYYKIPKSEFSATSPESISEIIVSLNRLKPQEESVAE